MRRSPSRRKRAIANGKKPVTSRNAKTQKRTTLAITVADDGSLPSEFRLFVPGWNDTENGRFLFDEAAAKAVMAAHEKWGVDLMIDLEHQALDAKTPPEPTARDARGWFRLELRPDGSLWATDVTWTEDGAQRLRDKRQRYVSPAFCVDPDSSRVTSIINVALVAIPATHETPALIAASAIEGHRMMSPETIKEALDALIAGDAEKCAELLKNIVAEAASGEPVAEEPETPAAEEPIEVSVTPPTPAEEKTEVIAATARLMRLTGKSSFVESLDEVEVWRMKALKADEALAQVAAERAILELGKRKENAITLTKLGAETPFTSGLNEGKLCERLLNEPLDQQNKRVAALLAARGGKMPEEIKPPVAAPSEALSEREHAMCKSMNLDPAKYAAIKTQLSRKP